MILIVFYINELLYLLLINLLTSNKNYKYEKNVEKYQFIS